MAKTISQPMPPPSRGKRFSLRTLFFASMVIAVPFLLMANLRHTRPEETVGSPLYLLLGIGTVVLAAGIGSALGGRTGMFAAAGLTALSWVGLVYLCGELSKEVRTVFPAHVVAAIASLAVLWLIVWSNQNSPEQDRSESLSQLLRAKHDVRERQQAKSSAADRQSPPALRDRND